jgi:hypothetical protein
MNWSCICRKIPNDKTPWLIFQFNIVKSFYPKSQNLVWHCQKFLPKKSKISFVGKLVLGNSTNFHKIFFKCTGQNRKWKHQPNFFDALIFTLWSFRLRINYINGCSFDKWLIVNHKDDHLNFLPPMILKLYLDLDLDSNKYIIIKDKLVSYFQDKRWLFQNIL